MSHSLIDAAAKGNTEKVHSLLDNGADVQWVQKKTGRTALSEAAINGHLEMAKLLASRGADLNWQDTAVGFSPVGWASECNHLALVDFLLGAGANPNVATHEYLMTPLMAASKNGNLPIVKVLLKGGANVNAAMCDGRTAISFAQTNKHTEVEKALAAVGGKSATPLPKPSKIPWPSVDSKGAIIDYSTPETVLRSFIIAMNRFEKDAAKLDKSSNPSARQQILKSMETVFDAYCPKKARPYGRNGSYRIPAEYDPKGEYLITVSLINPRRAELITRHDKFEEEYRYIVLKTKGRWLVDNKKRRNLGAEWQDWSL